VVLHRIRFDAPNRGCSDRPARNCYRARRDPVSTTRRTTPGAIGASRANLSEDTMSEFIEGASWLCLSSGAWTVRSAS
jgi:hypothetical protein